MRYLQAGEELVDILAPYRDVDRPRPVDRPWLVANMVCDLAGSTAIGGRVGALSHGADVELFRRLRSIADVVVVGAETVRREGYGRVRVDPSDASGREAPPIAVVSRSLRFDWTIPLFASDEGPRPILISCDDADPEAVAEAEQHAEVLIAGDTTVDLGTALRGLAERGADVVVCEGGPHLLGELVAGGWLDELCLTIAPLMGGDPLPVAVLPQGSDLHGFELVHVIDDGGTLLLRYRREAPGGP